MEKIMCRPSGLAVISLCVFYFIHLVSGHGDDTHECSPFYLNESLLTVTIKTPNYPANYPGGLHECWIIHSQLDDQPRVKLTANSFDLESKLEGQSQCSYDYLMVRDGEDQGAKEIGKYCGDDLDNDEKIVSSGTSLYLELHTDISNHRSGFKLLLTATDDEPTIKTGLSTGIIIGIVFGAVFALLMFGIFLVLCIKASKRNKRVHLRDPQEQEAANQPNRRSRITVIPRQIIQQRLAERIANRMQAPDRNISFVNVGSSTTLHYHNQQAGDTTSSQGLPGDLDGPAPPPYGSEEVQDSRYQLHHRNGFYIPNEAPPPYEAKVSSPEKENSEEEQEENNI